MPHEQNYMIHIRPLQSQHIEKYQPDILTTREVLLLFSRTSWRTFNLTPEITPHVVLPIFTMEKVISDTDGKDCTWLALRLFLNWLHRTDSVLLTEIYDEYLGLGFMLGFAKAIGAEGYQQCILEAKEWDLAAWSGLDIRKGSNGSLRGLGTEVGEFEVVRDAEEEAEYEFQESMYVDDLESKSDSESTTHLL